MLINLSYLLIVWKHKYCSNIFFLALIGVTTRTVNHLAEAVVRLSTSSWKIPKTTTTPPTMTTTSTSPKYQDTHLPAQQRNPPGPASFRVRIKPPSVQPGRRRPFALRNRTSSPSKVWVAAHACPWFFAFEQTSRDRRPSNAWKSYKRWFVAGSGG